MKYRSASYLLISAAILWSSPGYTQQYTLRGDCAFAVSKKFFNIVADDKPVTDADLDLKSTTHAATLKPLTPHPIEVAESQRAYNNGQFTEAATVVAEAATQEPADPTVLYCYARALYRGPGTRELSYPVYQRLVKLLDTYGRENANTTVVYTLFSEAYFKLGTLQLDNALWSLASYNLSRASLAMQAQPDEADRQAREQVLQYQTECFSYLGNTRLCRYFGARTLRLFPSNRYVQKYLALLLPPNKTAPKRKP